MCLWPIFFAFLLGAGAGLWCRSLWPAVQVRRQRRQTRRHTEQVRAQRWREAWEGKTWESPATLTEAEEKALRQREEP